MRWLWAGVVLLFLPAAMADVTTPLYAAFDGTQLQVIEPSRDSAQAGTCAEESDMGVAGDPTWILPFGAGPVEYDFLENGQPRFHPERGLAMDVHVTAAVLHWSMAIPETKHGLPLRLEAEIREGPEATDAGRLVARGTTESTMQAGLQEIVLPLQVEGGGEIRKPEGFVLTVRLQDGLDCAAPETLRVQAVSEQGHRSRLEVTTREGVFIDFVHPEVAAGVILIHTAFNAPFGTADLDIGNLTFAIEGPSTPKQMQEVVSQNAHVHNLHDKPVEATWIWNYREEEAANGTYNVTLTVWNLAHTASATEHARFILEGGECYCVDDFHETSAPTTKGAPAMPLAIPILAAILVTWLRRRPTVGPERHTVSRR